MKPSQERHTGLTSESPSESGYLRTWTYTADRRFRKFHVELDATEACAALIEIELMLVQRFLEKPHPSTALLLNRSALGVLAWHAVNTYKFGVIDVGGDIAPMGMPFADVAREYEVSLESAMRLIEAFAEFREYAILEPRELAESPALLRVRKEYKLKTLASKLLRK